LLEVQFRRYWTGQTVSMFGDQISAIAIPLAPSLCCMPTLPKWAT
jgi:hypothetical protein